MGGSYSQSFIESVRAAADIVSVVSDYVPLKPAGARRKGLCPFHEEKTPSFSVDPSQQLFYCFGCQTGGDLFRFVMLYEKVAFPEAVEMLARRFGVPVPPRDGRSKEAETERERLLRLNEAAAEYYRTLLAADAGARARDYLERRGIGLDTARRLGVGYAPDSWSALRDHLTSRRFSVDDLHRAGLVLERRSGPGHYDRFRDRLMFPILDVHGRTVAFGGRALGDAEPKYVNSPESPAYTKGDHLYGLDAARDAIRREGFAVVVEGYLDRAALVQAGFDNVVASLGTAFTPAQARLLARYADRVTVSYDGDAAGAKATARSFDLLLERGFEVRVVELPAGCDPDDFLRDHGPEAYERLLRDAPESLEFLVRQERRARDVTTLDGKIEAVNAVLPHLAKLTNAIERAAWAGRLADELGIEDELVLQELRSVLKAAETRVRRRPGGATRGIELRQAEGRLLALLLRSAGHRAELAAAPDWREDLAGSTVAGIVDTIVHMHEDGAEVDAPAVLAALDDDEDRERLTRIAFGDEPENGPDVHDCLWAFRRERLQRKNKETVRLLARIQTQGGDAISSEDVDRWLTEVQNLSRQRDAL